MKEMSDGTIYFYSSKIKNILLTMLSMLFVILGILACIVGYHYDNYIVIIIAAVLTVFFIWIAVYLIKRLFIAEPFLTINDQYLTINAPLMKEMPIKREDIGSYEVKHQNFSTSVELIVPDEKTYIAQLSGAKQKLNAIMTAGGAYNTFTIAVNQIKKKDRDLLYYVLNNMNKPDFALNKYYEMKQSEVTNRTKDSFQLEDKITKKYFLNAYGISFLIACFCWFIPVWGDINLIIASFFLFPFAKVLYDAIIGFKFDEKIKKQEIIAIPGSITGLIYMFYLLLFLFSFFIAPFGIMFLLIRAVYRFLKKKHERSHNINE